MDESKDELVRTSVAVPRRLWLALRRLAELKAMQDGGRASVNAAIVEALQARVEREDAAR